MTWWWICSCIDDHVGISMQFLFAWTHLQFLYMLVITLTHIKTFKNLRKFRMLKTKSHSEKRDCKTVLRQFLSPRGLMSCKFYQLNYSLFENSEMISYQITHQCIFGNQFLINKWQMISFNRTLSKQITFINQMNHFYWSRQASKIG